MMQISGVLMILISIFIDSDELLGHFDQSSVQPEILPDRLSCRLKHIADGDTVVANCAAYDLRIRLMGIDTPEMGQKPWGERSKRALAARLPKVFTLENHGQDVYQRTLGTLYAGDQDINLQMIELGMAVAYRGRDTPQRYYEAEKQAKVAKLGIWSKPGDQQDPRKWRRYHL
ncbi:thermonuclease family protein [Cardiobacteriaceae bacterium TAE3-ERU3]|nr:thermonuclease family protein [Cardiobacteriaceae bacterium TAE3-ERU3]